MNYLLLLGTSSLLASLPPAAPCLTQFLATPAQVDAGQPVLLTWTLTGGAPTRLTQEDDLSGAPPLDLLGRTGRILPGVTRRQTFTLKAANEAGTCSASLTVVARGLSLLVEGGGGLRGPATFRGPAGLAMDPGGNLLVAETGASVIRRISREGLVTVLAGQPGQAGSADGPAETASFREPEGLALDARTGTLFVADTGNHTLRAITPGGQVATLAGSPGQPGAVDGQGPNARFNEPRGLAVGADGTVYVADSANELVRQVSPLDGTVTTLAGQAGTWGFLDGPGSQAQFGYPWALAVDAEQHVFVADTFNNAIRKIASGLVTTVVGTPEEEASRDGDLRTARLHFPQGIVANPAGGFLVSESGTGRIRTLDAQGVGTLALGAGLPFKDPSGLALDPGGGLWVADTGRNAVLQLGADPGPAGAPRLRDAVKVVVDPSTGGILLGDGAGHLHRVSPRGGTRPLELRNASGQPMPLKGLGGLAVDAAGTLYTVNPETAALVSISSGGLVGDVPAPPGFQRPGDLAVDSGGNLYVSDLVEATVRKVSRGGLVSLFAGTPFTPGQVDGPGEGAKFTLPAGLAVDGGDNLIVADPGAHTIRRISPLGSVTTLAGKAGEAGSADGDAVTARFNTPQGVAVDGWGNVFVADTGNATVRRISRDGTVTTVAGVPGQAQGRLGPLPGGLTPPRSVAVTAEGDLLVLCGDGLVQVTAP